ncbi:MAG: ABC transporter permease [Candidatus Nanohaloarchaea archaeon]
MRKIAELLRIYFLDKIRRPMMVAMSLLFGLGFFVFLYLVFRTGGLSFGSRESFGPMFAASYLVFIPAYIAVYGVLNGLLEDSEKGVLKAYRGSRLTKAEYFTAKITTALISSAFIAAGTLVMTYLFTGVLLNPALVSLAVLMTVVSHSGIAFIAASRATDRQESQMAMQLFAIVLIFGTPVFYPETLLPESVRTLQQLMPLTHSIDLVRAIIQESVTAGLVIKKTGILAVFSAVLLGAGYREFQF